MKHCPKCDAIMEHQEAEPDVGISGGWYCPNEECGEYVEEEDEEDYAAPFERDMQILGRDE